MLSYGNVYQSVRYKTIYLHFPTEQKKKEQNESISWRYFWPGISTEYKTVSAWVASHI